MRKYVQDNYDKYANWWSLLKLIEEILLFLSKKKKEVSITPDTPEKTADSQVKFSSVFWEVGIVIWKRKSSFCSVMLLKFRI